MSSQEEPRPQESEKERGLNALRSRWDRARKWQKWTAGGLLALLVLIVIAAIVGGSESPDSVSNEASTAVTQSPSEADASKEQNGPERSPAELVAVGAASEWDSLAPDEKRAVASRFLAVSGFSDDGAALLVDAMDASSSRDGALRDALKPLAAPITRAEAREKARRARAEARREQAEARAREKARARARARERARRERLLRGTLVEGYGAKVVTVRADSDGPFVVEASHTGSSNFQVELVGNGVRELLVNEIGSYSGTVLARDVPSGRYRIAVEADGSWALRYRQPVPQGGEPSLLRTFTGSGSRVIQAQTIEALEPIITASHAGDSNFQVELVAYGDEVSGSELLFNEIGSYKGQTLTSIPAGDYLVSVVADGSWTLKFER